MAHITADRVRDTSQTTGTGAFTLTATALGGYRLFSAVCSVGDTFYYAIQHQTASEWEVGLGTYSSANTITRTTVYASSAGGSAVTFSSGTKDVFITLAAARTVQLDSNGAIAGITDAGDLTFTGTGRRITGDFSNGTIANRVMFQTSTANTYTVVRALPSGTGNYAEWSVGNNSDQSAATSTGLFSISTSEVRLSSNQANSGTILPLTFHTTGAERMRVVGGTGSDVGYVGIGTSSPSYLLDVQKNSAANNFIAKFSNSDTGGSSGAAIIVTQGSVTGQFQAYGNSQIYFGTQSNHPLAFQTNSAERMRIDSSGNVGINCTPSGTKLDVTVGDNSVAQKLRGATGLVRVYPYYNFGGNNRGVLIEATNAAESAYGDLSLSGSTIQFLQGAGTERMRIDSSGNVQIGSTLGNGKLQIYGDAVNFSPSADNNSNGIGCCILGSNVSSGGAASARLWMSGANAAHAGNLDLRSGSVIESTLNMYAVSGTKTVYFTTNGSSYINGGNVGIGTSSPLQLLHLAGAGNIGLSIQNTGGGHRYTNYTPTDGSLAWFDDSAGTERMRIDSSGNLGVGTTSPSAKVTAYSGGTNATTYDTMIAAGGGSTATIQNQGTTSVSTSATTILTSGQYGSFCLVFGSDGTNRFMDVVLFGLGTGNVNVISSLAVAGSPSARTYSQSSSTYKLAMASGTYTIQVAAFTMSG